MNRPPRIVTSVKDALAILSSGEPVKIAPNEVGTFLFQLERARTPVCLRFDYDINLNLVWINLWFPSAKPRKGELS